MWGWAPLFFWARRTALCVCRRACLHSSVFFSSQINHFLLVDYLESYFSRWHFPPNKPFAVQILFESTSKWHCSLKSFLFPSSLWLLENLSVSHPFLGEIFRFSGIRIPHIFTHNLLKSILWKTVRRSMSSSSEAFFPFFPNFKCNLNQIIPELPPCPTSFFYSAVI